MNDIILFLSGIIQGLTEFLPVSSSGHLVLFQTIFSMKEPKVIVDVILHTGTLLSVFFIFRDRIWAIFKSMIMLKKDEDFDLGITIIIGNIPTAIIGLTFEDFFKDLFDSGIVPVGIALFVTGSILLFTGKINKGEKKVSIFRSILIGISQGFAAIPGISRSGATIFTAMLTGVKAEKAFEYSFLLSIPAILGATVLEFKDADLSVIEPVRLIPGFIAAFVSGLFALKLLKKTVVNGRLYMFGIYCISISLLLILNSMFSFL